MKANQTPIYRAAERLLLWVIPLAERLPKSLPYQIIGSELVADIKRGIDDIICAMHAPDNAVKLRCINSLLARMASVKMTMRILLQMKIKYVPIVSYKQEAAFLDLINPICTQAGAWKNKAAVAAV